MQLEEVREYINFIREIKSETEFIEIKSAEIVTKVVSSLGSTLNDQ